MFKPNTAIFICALIVLALSVTATVTLADPTPTNYYLPKGYKVHATIHVPCAPFFPGEMVGGKVGLATGDYSVYVEAYGWKNPWNWAQYKSAVRVVWVQGGHREVKADAQVVGCDYDLDVVMTYDWNGHVTIATSRQKGGAVSALYGFTATVDKYSIVAEGAQVDVPQALPRPTTSNPVGGGYNPPSVNEIQTKYLLLGLGVGALVIGVLVAVMAMRRRGGKA